VVDAKVLEGAGDVAAMVVARSAVGVPLLEPQPAASTPMAITVTTLPRTTPICIPFGFCNTRTARHHAPDREGAS
jgi:hypothetical protein